MAKRERIIRKDAGPSVKPAYVPTWMQRAYSDSLRNFTTGMGTGSDKLVATSFIFREIQRPQLEAAYRSDWIARKGCDIPAEDATREWRRWEVDAADIKELEKTEREIGIQHKVKEALQKARLYGGAGLLLGVDDGGSLATELNLENVGQDALKFVHVVSRWEMAGVEPDWDIGSPYYGAFKMYRRNSGTGNTSQELIHPSRFIRFIGNTIPDLIIAQGWGDSVLQVATDAVMSAGTVINVAATLLTESKLDIIKFPDLTNSIGTAEYRARLETRMEMANNAKSVFNMLMLDKEEEWARVEMNLRGIPDYLQMYLLIVSGAWDIPATRFLGQSPAGLSATGESDIRNYYDQIASRQKTEIRPALAPLDEIICRSTFGTFDEDMTYEWKELWQLDEVQKADRDQKKSAAYNIDVQSGLIPAEVLRDARLNQLMEDEVYPGLEQILTDFGDLNAAMEAEKAAEEQAALQQHQQSLEQIAAKQQSATPGAPPAGNASAPPPANKKPFGDMVARIRDACVADATQKSLYVYRPVVNAKDIVAWAKKQGIKNIEPADELHVTLAYSNTAVDWTKLSRGDADWNSDDEGNYRVKPGGMRMMDLFGPAKDVLVLLFTCSQLDYRHMSLKREGAEWEWDDYTPHITIAKGFGQNNAAAQAIEAYRGEIILGPEVWEEIKAGGYV